MPYQFGPAWDPTTQVGAGYDSPKQPLAATLRYPPYVPPYTLSWYESTAKDSFNTWAMYKPPKVGSQGTVWMPMAKYTSRWQGTALKDSSGNWALSDTTPSKKDADPVGNASHPEWNGLSPGTFYFIGIS